MFPEMDHTMVEMSLPRSVVEVQLYKVGDKVGDILGINDIDRGELGDGAGESGGSTVRNVLGDSIGWTVLDKGWYFYSSFSLSFSS